MTELKPYAEAEPIGRREYERAFWGNGHAQHWDELAERDRTTWRERAIRDRTQTDGSLVGELVGAWTEVITINKFARQNGGKAHRRLWTAIDAIAESRGAKP
jgi:hypothetical protein